jgi:hypothetical protein
MREQGKAMRQKIVAEIVKGYVAIVDGPGCLFAEDWVEMFPDQGVLPATLCLYSLQQKYQGVG